MNAPCYEIIAQGDVELRHEVNREMQQRVAKHTDEIQSLWEDACARREITLYDGTLLTYARHEFIRGCLRVFGHFAEYKQFMAQRINPGLALGIRPIGVSGVVIGHSGNEPFTVFAKRAADTSTYGGFLELVPSGAIDKSDGRPDGTVDFQKRLFCEFEEEVSPVPEPYQCDITGFAFLYDIPGCVYDVCCKITTDLPTDFFVESLARSREYQSAVCVPIKDIDTYIKENHEQIIPTSNGIIKALTERP